MSKKQEEYRELKLSAHEYACLARGYYDSGITDRALECAENVLYSCRIDPKSVDAREIGECLRMRARILGECAEKNDWKKAFKLAERNSKKQKDGIAYADCLVDKGTAYEGLGKIKKAVRLRKKALKILKENKGGRATEKKALYRLGSTYYARKEDAKADACFTEAYMMGDPTDALLFALGSIKVRRGEYERALDFLFECKKMREETYRETPFHAALGEIYILIGDVYSLLKVYVKAVKYYMLAYRTYEITGGDENGYIETCKRLYGTYILLGEEDRAESFLMRIEE